MIKKLPYKLIIPTVVFIIVLILNIILGCSPVFNGKYTCYDSKQDIYYEIDFYDNTFDYYKKSTYKETSSSQENKVREERYYGFYNYYAETSVLYLDLGEFSKLSGVSDINCKRNSVFSFTVSTARGLYYEDKYEIQFTCPGAIVLQIFYVIIMAGCLGCLTLQYLKFKKNKEKK